MEHLVCERSELEERKPYFVAIGDLEIGIILVNDQVYAIENRCPHAEGPVCLGNISGRVRMSLEEKDFNLKEYSSEDEINLVCPWHGFEFDIASGTCIADSSFQLHKFETQRKNGKVYVII